MLIQPRLVSRRRAAHPAQHDRSPTSPSRCWWAGSAGWSGWWEFLLVQLPTALLAGSAGVWLFYVQHQFEDTYWENAGDWSYADAALRGSSYLRLPKVLQFFTGNIGLHHVHHLSARCPTTTSSAPTTRTRSSTTCRRSRSGTGCAPCG